ncbi:hypothetical protein PCE1_000180 [Barthelona sp. PCE]
MDPRLFQTFIAEKNDHVHVLRVITGPLSGRVFPLNDVSVVTIGRSNTCSITIPDKLVSRLHCRFTIGDDEIVRLEDQSQNGTFLNGARLRKQALYILKLHDSITVASTKLLLLRQAPTSNMFYQPESGSIAPSLELPSRPASSMANSIVFLPEQKFQFTPSKSTNVTTETFVDSQLFTSDIPDAINPFLTKLLDLSRKVTAANTFQGIVSNLMDCIHELIGFGLLQTTTLLDKGCSGQIGGGEGEVVFQNMVLFKSLCYTEPDYESDRLSDVANSLPTERRYSVSTATPVVGKSNAASLLVPSLGAIDEDAEMDDDVLNEIDPNGLTPQFKKQPQKSADITYIVPSMAELALTSVEAVCCTTRPVEDQKYVRMMSHDSLPQTSAALDNSIADKQLLYVPLCIENETDGSKSEIERLGLVVCETSSGVDLSRGLIILLTSLCSHTALALKSQLEIQKLYSEKLIVSRFENFLPTPLIQTLVTHSHDQTAIVNQLRGVEYDCATMFLDICGFTKLSEQLPSTVIIQILNQFYDAVLPSLIAFNGIIDKFLGDGLMAYWIFNKDGGTLKGVDSAHLSLCAALHMYGELEALNSVLPMFLSDKIETIDPQKYGTIRNSWRTFKLHMSVGINCGTAVAGAVGSANEGRLEFTVIGDTVNTAARIQGKAAPNMVLIHSAMFDMLLENDIDIYGFRMPPIPLKNKRSAISTCTVRAIRMSANNEILMHIPIRFGSHTGIIQLRQDDPDIDSPIYTLTHHSHVAASDLNNYNIEIDIPEALPLTLGHPKIINSMTHPNTSGLLEKSRVVFEDDIWSKIFATSEHNVSPENQPGKRWKFCPDSPCGFVNFNR